jgi:hypothetical protein
MQVLDRIRGRSRAIAHEIEVPTPDESRALERNRDRAIAHEVELPTPEDLELLRRGPIIKYIEARALAHLRTRARAITRAYDHVRAPIDEALRRNDLPEAQRLVAALEHDREIDLALMGRALSILLIIMRSETVLEMRQAQKQYMAFALEYTYGVVANEMWRWSQWWLAPRKVSRTQQEGMKRFSNVYWFVQIGRAREAGQLPVWEGIRIVREQVQV